MSDSDLYSRLLFPKKQGYPLFHPQPFDDLPETARRTGTKIGDVGLITQDGFFDPIFNILHARDDPSNRFGVPLSFEQVLLGPNDIATSAQVHPPGSHISNTTISKRRLDVEAGVENVFLPFGAGAVVEVSTDSKETGLLLLPDGASRWDLRRQQVFRDYALKHAHNWYTFVNGYLQRMAGNGDLYLVTGVTKSTSWSVAALENHSGEGKVSLKLKAAQIGNAGAACAWEWESADSSVNSGPRRCPGEEDWRDNQTVFLRGFKVALRSTPLRRAPKIRTVVNSKWSDMSSKGTFIPFPQSQSSTAGTVMPNSQPQSSGNNVDCLDQSLPSTTGSTESSTDDEESLRSSNCYHPSALINEHLLDCVAGATVAVTHDDEWASVLSEEDSEVPDHHELMRRISNKFQMSIVYGGVCLESLESDLDSLSAPAIQQTTHLDNSADSRRIRFTPLPDPKRSVLLSDDGDGLPLPAAAYTAVPPPSPMPSRSPLPPKLMPSPDASQPMVGSAETKPAWRTALGGWGSTKGSSLTRTQSQTSTASTPTPKIPRWSWFRRKDGDDKGNVKGNAKSGSVPPALNPFANSRRATRKLNGTVYESRNANEPALITQPKPKAAAPVPVKPQISVSKIEPYSPDRAALLFKKYADEDEPNTIGPEGFEKLCIDAQIPLDGALPLILAWQLNAKDTGKFTKDEWTKGTESLKISSLSQLSMAVSDLEMLLVQGKPAAKGSTGKKDPYDKFAYGRYAADPKAAFQTLYSYCFTLAKPEQSRNIDMETSTAFWSVLLVPQYPLMSEVLEFIAEKGSYKATNKDLWSMMLEFCRTVKPTLHDYEADGAWPTLLDDFVAWKKAKLGNGAAE